MNTTELDKIKERVSADMKHYLSSFKDMFEHRIYDAASSRIIPWRTLKLGNDMQQRF